MIELSHISKSFSQGGQNKVHAVRDVSIQIKSGEFVVMLGANGSGKSTLLNLISGTFLPDTGNILINDQSITGLPEYKRSKWVSRVFQDPTAGTASELTVLENFRLAAIRTQDKNLQIGTGLKFREKIKEQIATLNLGLENKVDQLMGTLSGGQRQALTLLMAVMDKTELLLMDEPASALDPKTAALIMSIADKIIAQYSLTAILVTHNLREAEKFGNRIIHMSNGRIVKDLSNQEKRELTIGQLLNWFDN